MSGDGILDAIDSALDDWTVSADAMRYVPEEAEERREPGGVLIGPINAELLGEGWTEVGWMTEESALDIYRRVEPVDPWPEDRGCTNLAVLRNLARPLPRIEFSVDRGSVLDALAEAFGPLRDAVRRAELAMRPLAALARTIEPAEPTDLRERALWLRQNRNTGPAQNPHRHRGIGG